MAGLELVSSFGDAEPEDAWDAGDPADVKLANLLRRLELLDAGAAEAVRHLGAGDPIGTLEELDARARRVRIRVDDEPAELRRRLILVDVAELLAELEAGRG